MKKTLSVLCSLALVPALFADEDSVTASNGVESDTELSYVFASMPVSNNMTKTFISVPWCAQSLTNDSPIEVSNIVKTANLTVGDTLSAYRSATGSFDTWILTNLVEGSSTEVTPYWLSVSQPTESDSTASSPDSASSTIERGNALVLIRQHPEKMFWLNGYVGTNTSVTMTVTRGTATAPAYSIVAPCLTNDVNVIAAGTLSNPGANDSIWVGGSEYVYTNNSWQIYKDSVWKTGIPFPFPAWVSTNSVIVPAGTGFTYVSRDNTATTAPSFTWKTASTTEE